MTGPHKNPRVSTQRHPPEVREKISKASKQTRLNELKPCEYDGCSVVTNNGSMKRHVKSSHLFTCRVDGCPESKHKGLGLCRIHWTLSRICIEHGVTLDLYLSLYNSQKGLCKICNRPCLPYGTGTDGRKMETMHLDHDHATGKFRGLLCGSCNSGLGYFKDKPELLSSAIEYLKAANNDEYTGIN